MDVLASILTAVGDFLMSLITWLSWIVWEFIQLIIEWLDFDPFKQQVADFKLDVDDGWSQAISFIGHWVPMDFALDCLLVALSVMGFYVLFTSLYRYFKFGRNGEE